MRSRLRPTVWWLSKLFFAAFGCLLRGSQKRRRSYQEIFGEDARFKPARLYRLARSKAYLFAGVEIRWRCDPELASEEVPAEEGEGPLGGAEADGVAVAGEVEAADFGGGGGGEIFDHPRFSGCARQASQRGLMGPGSGRRQFIRSCVYG